MSDGVLFTGFGQYTSLLLRHLPVAGVAVVAYGAPGEPRPAWLPAAVEWMAPDAPRAGRLRAMASRLGTLPRSVGVERLDVFHSPAVHVRPSLPPVARPRCPTVSTVHDVIPLSYYGGRLPWRLRTFYRWNLGRALGATRVVTVSATARNDIERLTGFDVARVEVIPNAVEFTPNGDDVPLARLGVRRPYLLYAGSYEPRKNLRGALEAFALLRERGDTHSLVALVERESGHAARVHALIEELRLRERVTLVHSLDSRSIRALYTHADLVLFPSLAEGFGFPPLQAAACRTPVVAHDLSVLRETMGDAAVFVDATDPAAIADAAAGLLCDATRRARLIERAHARVACFSVERFVRRHLEVYRAAASVASAA